MIFGITIPKVSMNFGIRLFFFLSLPRQTIHTSMIERQLQQKIESRMFAGNHRYRSAAGGQKYAFKDDTCVKETAVITPDNWMEWVV